MIYFSRLPKFEYIAPKTLEEALSFLEEQKDKAKVIAGGTDLLIQMKNREVTPQYLIGLKNISGIDYIKYSENDGLRFGALSTIGSVESLQVIRDKYSILAQATRSMASAQIRNVATVAGNICTAVPSADTAPALIVLGARLKLLSPKGDRMVAVEEFFTGPCQTVLRDVELLTEIHVPKVTPNSKGVYLKHGLRRAMNLATVGVAVMITADNGYCRDIRIALGAVAPIPLRATGAEAVLRGQELSDDLIEEAARVASGEARPISDIRASAEYRRELVRVLTQRAVKQACGKTK